MRQHHLISLILLCVAAGCASKTEPTGPEMVSGQAFVKVWEASLTGSGDPLAGVFVRDDRVVAYTRNHVGFWLGADGGTFLSRHPIVTGDRTVHPPLLLGDQFYVPTALTIENFDKSGRHLRSIPMPSAVQSPAVGTPRAIFLSLAHAGSGRLTRFNITDRGLSFSWAMYTAQGVVAAPAELNDAVYAGGNDGRVWAITGGRDALWALPGGENTFQTGGKITADLAVDEYGVYVASQDKRLYCLDRTSGRIRWAYYASAPLLDQPFVTATHVYQLVPNVGLVAIDKTEGKQARDPLWIQPIAQQVLSVDERNVYVKAGGSIVAVDRVTGQPTFRSRRTDFTICATNTKTPMIYAATRAGSLLAIQPVLRPGTVGEMALNPAEFEPIALAR